MKSALIVEGMAALIVAAYITHDAIRRGNFWSGGWVFVLMALVFGGVAFVAAWRWLP